MTGTGQDALGLEAFRHAQARAALNSFMGSANSVPTSRVSRSIDAVKARIEGFEVIPDSFDYAPTGQSVGVQVRVQKQVQLNVPRRSYRLPERPVWVGAGARTLARDRAGFSPASAAR